MFCYSGLLLAQGPSSGIFSFFLCWLFNSQSKLAAHYRDVPAIQERLKTLEKQNNAVGRHVSQLILEKQPHYQHELDNVLLLQEMNGDAYERCTQARRFGHFL